MALDPFRYWANMRNAARRLWLGGEARNDDGTPTVHAGRVLSDLREFCRFREPCYTVDKTGKYDTHMTAVLQGRREVLLRIQHLLDLDDETLLKMRNPDVNEEE